MEIFSFFLKTEAFHVMIEKIVQVTTITSINKGLKEIFRLFWSDP